MEKLTVCLLASGSLGFSLLEHLSHKNDVTLHSVFTDKKSDGIISFCTENNIPCFSGNPRGGATAEFRNSLKNRPDIILSINYLFLIEDDLISYPKKYAVNVHGSLLPKYRGRTPHVWAIINNEKQTGITAHLITRECDRGGIIAQKVIPIEGDDTGGSLLEKYKENYPLLIDDVIARIQSGNLEVTEQDESKATYFPKRTPDDGEIDWHWQRERIYNWVRSMAPPEYPGAFFYDGGKKITVQRAEFSDAGFSQGCENGEILCRNKNEYIVKVQNGCLSLVEFDGGGYKCRVVFYFSQFNSFKAGLLCA